MSRLHAQLSGIISGDRLIGGVNDYMVVILTNASVSSERVAQRDRWPVMLLMFKFCALIIWLRASDRKTTSVSDAPLVCRASSTEAPIARAYERLKCLPICLCACAL